MWTALKEEEERDIPQSVSSQPPETITQAFMSLDQTIIYYWCSFFFLTSLVVTHLTHFELITMSIKLIAMIHKVNPRVMGHFCPCCSSPAAPPYD